MQILEFVSLSERHTAPKITLTPSQRKAAEGVLLGLKRGDCAVLQDLGSDGKTEFSYAHPLFWAPYSIIGDGGAR